MGSGIDAARSAAPDHAALMDNMKDQLIIVLMKRLADTQGRVIIPVSEIDDTGRDLLSFSLQGMYGPTPTFHFQLDLKS